jgi:hypothetical protein
MNNRFVVWSMSCAVGLWACGGSSGDTPPQAPPASQASPGLSGSNQASALGTGSGSAEVAPSGPADGGVAAASVAGNRASEVVPAASSVAAGPVAAPESGSPAEKNKPGDSATTKAAASKAAAKAPKTATNVGAHPSAASGGAEGSAVPAGARVFDCGDKGQKPCPAQGWMKANMAPAAASGDAAGLAKQFDYVAAHAPPGLANWAAIAQGGSAKAKAGDIDGAKAACKTCHDQYKAKYKAELRDRPF